MNRSEQLLAILAEECNEVAQKMQWKANNKLRVRSKKRYSSFSKRKIKTNYRIRKTIKGSRRSNR
jgi:hypothetical protein